MSLDSISGLTGNNFATVDRTGAVTQTATEKQAAPEVQAAAAKEPSSAQSAAAMTPFSTKPLLLVPTDPPLTTAVLAEITARQAPTQP